MNTTQFILTGWNWNGAALALAAGLLVAHGLLFGMPRRAGWLAAALGMLLLTLMSPIETLADGYLFCAHMAQHILLLLVIPALLLLSLPRQASLTLKPRALGHPMAGWIAGVGAMWIWHEPALCNAAVSSPLIRILQTLSLLLLGGLFWRQILAPKDTERLTPPAAVAYLFSACATCSVLGIIITLSPVAVCSIYCAPQNDAGGILSMIRNDWHITPEEDQKLGGLLMWVPMCLIYFAAILGQIAHWFVDPTPALAERAP
jgi:putative membrane protein